MKIKGFEISLCGLALALILSLTVGTPALAQGTLDVDSAITNTHMALEADSSNRDARLRLVKLYFVKGARALEAGNDSAAINSLSEALRVAEEGYGQISDSEEVILWTDYALAHATNNMGRTEEVISILDGLAAAAPDFYPARYMLGLTLMRSSNQMDFDRGLEVMRQLYNDVPYDMQQMVGQAGANLGYERAMSQAEGGNTSGALALMQEVDAAFGEAPFDTPLQGQNFEYGLGWLSDETGDTATAVEQYQMVHDQSSTYAQGGAQISGILADAYYKRALELISEGSMMGAEDAVDMLNRSEQLGGESVDIHHARYLAYNALGDTEAADQAEQAIKDMDMDYYNSITTR